MKTILVIKSPDEWRTKISGTSHDEIRLYNLETLPPADQQRALNAALLAVLSKNGKVVEGRSLLEIPADYQLFSSLESSEHAT